MLGLIRAALFIRNGGLGDLHQDSSNQGGSIFKELIHKGIDVSGSAICEIPALSFRI